MKSITLQLKELSERIIKVTKRITNLEGKENGKHGSDNEIKHDLLSQFGGPYAGREEELFSSIKDSIKGSPHAEIFQCSPNRLIFKVEKDNLRTIHVLTLSRIQLFFDEKIFKEDEEELSE